MSNEVESSETPRKAKRDAGDSIVFLLFLLFLGVIVGCLLMPRCITYRTDVSKSLCMNRLKQILLALHNYHDTYKCFPPAYVPDKEGRPMHSWRVLILPFLEEGEDLYEQYRFDEPWNGPNNSQLADQIPEALRCRSEPSENAGVTSYLLVAGDGTAWADGQAPRFADFTDGVSNTIIVVEAADSGILWIEPRDLTIDQAMRGVNSERGMGISSWHPVRGKVARQETAHAGFADGSVTRLKNDFPLDDLKELLTHQGGETVD